MPDRSYLFVPGNLPNRFEKARDAGADAVILDLEDAVPVKSKSEARAAVAAWLDPDRPAYVPPVQRYLREAFKAPGLPYSRSPGATLPRKPGRP